MTSEEKARAWELAAELVSREYDAMRKRGEATHIMEHAIIAVAPSLRCRAMRIRESSKARRERGR